METNKELITDAQIEQAALKHVAPLFGKIGAGGDYKLTEQFSRLKAFTAELFALSQRSEVVFPPRDTTKPAEQQGLFNKFNVQRTDGSDVFGKKHFGCKYFVLDLDHDEHAGAAMRAYAQSCRATHPLLADDIEAKWGRSDTAPAPSAAAGEKAPAWDADATTRLRSIVDLLGLQSSVPDGDLTGYEFAVLGFMRREIERLKAAAQPSLVAAGEQPFPFAWPHAQRIVEAEQFLKTYSDPETRKLLDYEVQPIIRVLASMIGQWQQAAAHAMSADNCAAQPTPAQGDAVPVGYSFKRIEGYGWYVDPPNHLRWVAFDGTPAGDLIAELATRKSSADAVGAALELSVSAIYFDDGSKYEGALWNIVRALSPSILELLHADPRAAFYAVKSDIAAQGGKGGAG